MGRDSQIFACQLARCRSAEDAVLCPSDMMLCVISYWVLSGAKRRQIQQLRCCVLPRQEVETEGCLYSGFVFCTGDGKVYLPNAINRTIRSICADYNKEEESKAKEENRDPVFLPKFSCHILRHTFCTRFCENETNLKVIQEIMGHADISTTMDVYAEATQEKKKESMTSLQSALLVR